MSVRILKMEIRILEKFSFVFIFMLKDRNSLSITQVIVKVRQKFYDAKIFIRMRKGIRFNKFWPVPNSILRHILFQISTGRKCFSGVA